ncbi:PREDICTED: IST1 homolog [Fragaria vesca subsp. vesca]|uniref:IST1 homolog n=1 Tax=Fragaria vesca subsp. vesca TaxID=101020 RepID=UPI0002C2FD11|nr:PREDICTED: IST1 homolog [Fragaria vesca subsp. vesca]
MVLARIKVVRNDRLTKDKQMRDDIKRRLQEGHEVAARILVEHLTRIQNSLAAYKLIEIFCQLVVERLLIIKKQRQCLPDLKEGVASLIFAAPRYYEIPELMTVKKFFEKKYGKDFVSAANDLRPNCGVSRKMIENLSIKAPSGEAKLKLMKEIAKECSVELDATKYEKELFEPREELIEGPTTFVSGATLPLQCVQSNKVMKTSCEERGNMHYQDAPSAAEAATIFASEAMSAAQAAAILANQASSQSPHCVDSTMSETPNVDDDEGLVVDEEETPFSDEMFARFRELKLRR